MNNTPMVRQNTTAVLSKTKNLMRVTNKILENKSKFIIEKPLSTIKESVIPKIVGNISDDPTRVIEFEDNIGAWIDKDTGLMWEVKSRENIEHLYVWNEEEVEKSNYPHDLTDDVKDAFSYAKKLNAQSYAEFTDWRVPTLGELATIMTEEEEKINDDYYIKSPLLKNVSTSCWSSTTDWDDDGYAWHIYFCYGYMSRYYKSAGSSVRCVRAGH